jgi:LMBR1 domain-containing protein 1
MTAGCAGYDDKFCGGLNMEGMWNAFFVLVPVWVFVLIPFMTFYYEADDGMLMAGTSYAPNPIKRSRIGEALCYQIFVFLIVGAFFAVMYVTLSDTKIPVEEYTGLGFSGNGIGVITRSEAYNIPALPNNTGFNSSYLEDMNERDTTWLLEVQNKGEQTLELQVSVTTFFGNLMAWIGWFLFALFGGIGLAALPLDLILAYVNRPVHLDALEYAEVQLSLRERVNEMVDIGELIKIEREEKAQAGLGGKFAAYSFDTDKRKAARDERQAILGFKQAVFLLEKDVEDFQAISADADSYNPLMPYVYLLFGCCSIIISLFWFIHILVYIIPDPAPAPFLNSYFSWFDTWFPMFGVLSVAIFTSYLLLCAVKGCFKFGIRFFFFHIHPMKPGKTYMSSFMFNTALVLLCSMPVVQFCQEAFADYAAFANIRQIFGVQIEYLQFFSLFWTKNIFIYCFLIITVLTSVYLACQPTDQAANGQALRDRLRARVT